MPSRGETQIPCGNDNKKKSAADKELHLGGNALKLWGACWWRIGVGDLLVGGGFGWWLVGEGLAVGADEAVAGDDGRGGVELSVVGHGEADVAAEAGDEKDADFALTFEGDGEPGVVVDLGKAGAEA